MKSKYLMPTKDGKEFQALAEEFGFRLVGRDARGHAVWASGELGEFTTCCSPRDRHAWRNARRDLFRMAGVRPPSGKRGKPEPPSALNRLVFQAKDRGYSITLAQARALLADHDGDLADAASELAFRCDQWDGRRRRRERLGGPRRAPGTPSARPYAVVSRESWPIVRMRLLHEVRRELDARQRDSATRLGREMRKALSRARLVELLRVAA